MVRALNLTGYIEPARRGITQPLIVRAQDSLSEETIFLKTRAGYSSHPEFAGVELFTTLLAKKLGVPVPTPVVVNVPKGAERMILDAPKFSDLLKRSEGTNFGTIAMGNDWKTWLPGMSAHRFGKVVETVLAFDGLVQHTDREADNPNMLWNDDKLVLVDHEKAFGYLNVSRDKERPWRTFASGIA